MLTRGGNNAITAKVKIERHLQIALQQFDEELRERGDFLVNEIGYRVSPIFKNLYHLLVWMDWNDYGVEYHDAHKIIVLDKIAKPYIVSDDLKYCSYSGKRKLQTPKENRTISDRLSQYN